MAANTQSALASAIGIVSQASPAQFENLIHAATGLPPTASPAEFAAGIAEETGLPAGDIQTLVRAVLTFLFAAYQSSIPQEERPRRFLQPVSKDFPKDGEALSERIKKLLSVPSLRIRAKADYLVRAHNNELLSSIVVTDQRPIFGDLIDEGEQGVLIYENLNLTYLEAGRELRTLSLACDSDDLKSLKAQIDRALEKRAVMESSLQRDGRQVWFLSEQDDED